MAFKRALNIFLVVLGLFSSPSLDAGFPRGVARVGKFTMSTGLDRVSGSMWKRDARAYIAKSLAWGLGPDRDFMGEYSQRTKSRFWRDFPWIDSPLTKLEVDLQDRHGHELDEMVEVNVDRRAPVEAQYAFGHGRARASVRRLKKCSQSAQIVTDPQLMPPRLFHYLVEQFGQSLDMRKTVQETVGRAGWHKMRAEHADWGFLSERGFDRATQNPLILAACGVCHSQEAVFFVEADPSSSEHAFNKLRQGDLSHETPAVMLSVPGIDFRKWRGGGLGVDIDRKSGRIRVNKRFVKIFVESAWKTFLASAVAQNVRHICLMSLGLGGFLPYPGSHNDPLPRSICDQIAEIYFGTLCEVLELPVFRGKFDGLYLNPNRYPHVLRKVLSHHRGTPLEFFDGDVMLQAVEFSKAGIRCGVLNPSAAHVLYGQADIGNHYKVYGNLAEELLASVSSAFVGSRFMCDVYTNPAKIRSMYDVPELTARGSRSKSHRASSRASHVSSASSRKAPDDAFNTDAGTGGRGETWNSTAAKGPEAVIKRLMSGRGIDRLREVRSVKHIVGRQAKLFKNIWKIDRGLFWWAGEPAGEVEPYFSVHRDVFKEVQLDYRSETESLIPVGTDLSGDGVVILGDGLASAWQEKLEQFPAWTLRFKPKDKNQVNLALEALTTFFGNPDYLAELVATGSKLLVAGVDKDANFGVVIDGAGIVQAPSGNAVGAMLMAVRDIAFFALRESYFQRVGAGAAQPSEIVSCPFVHYMLGAKGGGELGHREFWQKLFGRVDPRVDETLSDYERMELIVDKILEQIEAPPKPRRGILKSRSRQRQGRVLKSRSVVSRSSRRRERTAISQPA